MARQEELAGETSSSEVDDDRNGERNNGISSENPEIEMQEQNLSQVDFGPVDGNTEKSEKQNKFEVMNA
jgi:hypothetical protein